ncbi:MAG TPA: transposase, partial [Bacilli bacterium]
MTEKSIHAENDTKDSVISESMTMDHLDSMEVFLARFPTEEACVDYLIEQKWPAGYACDRCGCRSAYRTHTRRLPLFECMDCLYQASPIVGTVMEGSRTPMRKWFVALFL